MLTSATNPKILHLVKIRKDVKTRRENKSAIVIGEKFIREIMTIAPLKLLLGSYPLPANMSMAKDKFFLTDPRLLTKICGIPVSKNMIAEFETSSPHEFPTLSKLLVLERIADPGNLGAIVRSQMAFGWNKLFLLPGCCDLFNDKVIRASAASVFRVEWKEGSWEELLSLVSKHKLSPYVADINGKDVHTIVAHRPCLLLSNEATGLSEKAKNWGEKITIPMKNKIESLNVAVAGAVLLYTL